jgi:hypothetical protein
MGEFCGSAKPCIYLYLTNALNPIIRILTLDALIRLLPPASHFGKFQLANVAQDVNKSV